MTTAWASVQISDVCEQIVDCVNKTAPVVDGPTPYKMIRTTNVRDGWVDTTSVRYVEEDVYKQWIRRGAPKRGDIILTREAPLGEVGLLRDDRGIFLGQRLVMYRADPKKLNNHFLLYSFLHHDLQGQIKAFGSGSTVEHMRVPDCAKLVLQLPPLETQQKIASILSAYDNLIENNTRRIKILEEMAQAIYREWFVNFRFPGHEKVKMVDSSLGEIPEGWEVVPATEAIEIKPRTKVAKEGEKAFVPMGSLSIDSMLISNVETKTGNSGSKFKNGDTLFARITPCLENGKTGFVQFLSDSETTAFGSTEFVVLRSITLCPEYVYLMARSDEFRDNAIKSMSGATGRQRVSEKCFEQFYLAQPDARTLGFFSGHVTPMFQELHVLAKKNKNLRQTRDLLLPKLISGEIDVSTLEIEVKETAT